MLLLLGRLLANFTPQNNILGLLVLSPSSMPSPSPPNNN